VAVSEDHVQEIAQDRLKCGALLARATPTGAAAGDVVGSGLGSYFKVLDLLGLERVGAVPASRDLPGHGRTPPTRSALRAASSEVGLLGLGWSRR